MKIMEYLEIQKLDLSLDMKMTQIQVLSKASTLVFGFCSHPASFFLSHTRSSWCTFRKNYSFLEPMVCINRYFNGRWTRGKEVKRLLWSHDLNRRRFHLNQEAAPQRTGEPPAKPHELSVVSGPTRKPLVHSLSWQRWINTVWCPRYWSLRKQFTEWTTRIH